ncbi:hypothetical protein D9601_01085 [Sphingomonas sp. MA1305]|nr:hypothetical protein [Sphingomonas sp. MA1305]
MLPTMAVYLGLLVLLPFAIHYPHLSGPPLWLLAIVPAVPLSAVFWFYGRYLVEEPDEYVRMLEVRKALMATGVVMGAASAWGFLEMFAQAPHVPLYAAPIAWFPCQGIAALIVAAAERRSNP